ncbi:NnrS family protein [Halomonas sp. G15]|uniref:NnrS family protein n=1 Tax=Halomonas sp. G15 TaxID=2903521 RepID=UPI001E4B026D|nr:NnrS family protein [Halomonas sp. G15]MCE0734407.1 NnrS family protein [Halomonas sp. G15]
MSTKADISRPTLPAWRLFFPLAALHAAITVPLTLAVFYHGLPLGLIASPAAHGRELLFGFALAVIAGYLLGPLSRRWLLGLAAPWLVARIGGLVGPEALPVLLADALFAALLAWRLVPRFQAAKKWRNRMLSPLLGLLCLLAIASLAGRLVQHGMLAPALMRHAVLWLVLWRLWRWRPWACRQRPDLLGLMLGYAWLGVGLLLAARVLWLGQPLGGVLHAFTVGALGTLASGIMLRQAILRAKGRPERESLLLPLALLFTVAAVLRLVAFPAGAAWLPLLWASALAWSLAWLLTAWRLLGWSRRVPSRTRI